MEDGIYLDPDKSQSISDWEREQNRMLEDITGLVLSDVITGAEFQQYCDDRGSKGVNVAYREDFLSQNGYAYSREDMMNPDLPHSWEVV